MPLVAAAALLAGAAGAGGTAALWRTDGSEPLPQLVAGDLAIDLVGPSAWLETSADVPTAPRPIDPATFLARPGDAVTLRQQFTTGLSGDNLSGLLAVGWDDAPSLPAGASATYAVRDADDVAIVAGVPVGTAAPLERLDTDDDGRSDVFTLEVTIELAADMADRTGAGAAPQVADLGDVVLTLDQTRTGQGFTS